MSDSVAQQTPAGVKRIVLWTKNIDNQDLMNQIPNMPHNIENCLAFSLSTINKIGQVLRDNIQMNKPRIDRAFIKAGKSENN